MGFPREQLETEHSWRAWRKWRSNHCQPNFRQNVYPDPTLSCGGPYAPVPHDHLTTAAADRVVDRDGHDTVGMIAVDHNADMAVATSTNGAKYKIPGRVADSSIVGAGAYVDNQVGAAAASGDGDVMMRTLPSYQCVESMRDGATPSSAAAAEAVHRMAQHFPDFKGAVICVNKQKEFGAACHNLGTFTYTYQRATADGVRTRTVQCSGDGQGY